MRKIIALLLIIGMILLAILARPEPGFAQVGDAGQLIAEVNALRVAYGLAPLKADSALMSAAQKHSDYQASIGTWTHSGPGGSRPHDRAVAAGYGGGAQVFVSENVATGINLSPSRAVNELWQDAVHLDTMISPLFTHIGAGVGQQGEWVYYTIDVGYIAGSAGSGTSEQVQPPPVDSGTSAPPQPSAIPIQPISTARPGRDGSIQHVVEPGQFLINIAAAYQMELSELLALNGLSEQAVIYPGDKLLIQAASTQLPALLMDAPLRQPVENFAPGETPSSTPTTNPPTPTTTPVPVAMGNEVEPGPTMVISTAMAAPADDRSGNGDYLLYAVFGLAASGLALILFGSALKRHT